MAAVLKVREERTGTKAVSPRALGFTTKASMKNVEVRLNRHFCLWPSRLFHYSIFRHHLHYLIRLVLSTACRHGLMLRLFEHVARGVVE